jgi:flavin-dependent dehydrogenase
VKDLVFEDGRVAGIQGRGQGGSEVTDRAAVVVGADGLRSTVARVLDATVYDQIPPVTHTYYTYWSGVPLERLELGAMVGLGFAIDPTNDGLTMVALGWATWAHQDVRHDVERNYLAALKEIPPGERVLSGHREERFAGMSNIPNLMRQPSGPGWALIGDAGYHKDPAPAQGISDAFRDAELITEAVHGGLTEGSMDERLAEFARLRDESAKPWYRWAPRASSFRPMDPPMRELLEAISERRDLTDRFAGVYAKTVKPRDFWGPVLGQSA